MSLVITGYLNAPQGSPGAVAVQFDAGVADPNSLLMGDGINIYMPQGSNGSVVLTASYYPIGCDALGVRESFVAALPYVCRPGTGLSLPKREAHALMYLGAARAN